MTETLAVQKSKEAHNINQAAQELIDKIHDKDRRLTFWATTFFSVLFIVGIVGIYYQNKIANQNKQHIDCIVKLFTTPLPPNARTRVITNPSGTCNINFSK